MSPQSNNDRYQQHPLPDDFPISTLGGYRQNIVAPAGPFEPEGSWEQVFGIHSTGTGSSRVGTLTLTRRTGDGPGVSLGVRHEKRLTGSTGARRGGPANPRRVLEAELQLPDARHRLSAPKAWSFQCRVFDAEGRVIPEASLKRRAIVQEGKLRLTTGEAPPRTVPLEGEYTVHWALFDAVARLPREPFEPIGFTLVDHFDQVKPGQTLVFRRAIDTPIGGQSLRLFGFDQTGRGVMPWTYWVDQAGRAVVVVSGLETYMLESASG